jgi:DNA polymerase-3 subunit delta
MSFESLLRDVQSKKFLPIYFLEGEETYFIDELANAIEGNVLSEAERGFNQQIFYGKEAKMLDIINASKRYPMMSERQLILVREAQYVLNLAKSSILLDYLGTPLPSTVLVFLYKGKKVNKTTKVGKALKKYGLLTSNKLYDNQLPAWLENHLRLKGLKMEEKAKYILLEQAGNNLSSIAKELEKLSSSAKDGKITVKDMELLSGLNRSYNVFEYQKALGQRNPQKALEIAKYFGQDLKSNPLVLILSSVFGYFKKVHMLHFINHGRSDAARAIGVSPYFLKDYIQAANNYRPEKIREVFNHLADADRISKGIESGKVDESKLLQEMTVKIIE